MTWSHRLTTTQDTPKRLEDAAKFCTGLYGITYAILLGANKNALQNANGNNLQLVAILWLISLVAAFLVVFPLPYAYRSDSAASIREMHGQVVRFKYRALLISTGLYLLALGMLT